MSINGLGQINSALTHVDECDLEEKDL